MDDRKAISSRVRHVRLHKPEAPDDPRIDALIGEALGNAESRSTRRSPQGRS